MADLEGLKLLFVEDEEEQRELVKGLLEMDGAQVIGAANGIAALECLAYAEVDILVSDIRMPFLDGLGLAERVRREQPQMPVVLCTAFTDTDYLLRAIELGVSAYVPKPLDYDKLAAEILRVAGPVRQRQRIARLEQEALRPLHRALGDSPGMRALAAQARALAQTRYPVLLLGETGTGKSLLARKLHDASPVAAGPFVVAHLGAIPEATAESELFGHVRGAFTGAIKDRLGLFRQAQGGSLFLDDIDTASPSLQVKILHAVETGRIIPLGSDRPLPVDTRILAASNIDLMAAATAGRFRLDLFYRLGNLSLRLPPLRERGDEILTLARCFLREACNELGRQAPDLDRGAGELLRSHPWPGNLRELKFVMGSLAVFAGERLTAEAVRDRLTQGAAAAIPGDRAAPVSPPTLMTLDEAEMAAIRAALGAAKGVRMEAARLLGIDYQRLKRKLIKYGLVE